MDAQVLLGWAGAATALIVAIGGIVGVINSRRAGVAGDEREARRDEAVQRREMIADLQEERDHWKGRAQAAEALLDIEQEWRRALVDQVYRLRGTPVPRPTR